MQNNNDINIEQLIQPDNMTNATTTQPTPTKRRSVVASSLLAQNLLQAHVALLDNEIVAQGNQTESYQLLHVHLSALQDWHQLHTGWRVQNGRNYIRLERHLHAVTPVFTNEKLKKARDFACFAWLLWFAEKRYLSGGGRNQQFLLTELIDALQEQTQVAVGEEQQLDFRNQYTRFSMWHALDYLTSLGGITTLEGETRKWADEGNALDNEVLYEFTDLTHSLVQAVKQDRITAIRTHLHDDQRLQPALVTMLSTPIPPLTRTWRSLLLGPIFLRYDDPEAFAALTKQAQQVYDELSDTFGWLLELNKDYACIVRGSSLSASSGPDFTTFGGYSQIILLLCTALREQVENSLWHPDSYGCLHLNHLDLLQIFTDLRQRYGSQWSATIQAQKADDLFNELYQRMRQYGILRGPDTQGELLILPTAARYHVTYDTTREPQKPRTPTKTSSSRKKTNVSQISLETL